MKTSPVELKILHKTAYLTIPKARRCIQKIQVNKHNNRSDYGTHQDPFHELTMKNSSITTDQLIWGALLMGWIFGVATMLLLGYNPDNCFVGM